MKSHKDFRHAGGDVARGAGVDHWQGASLLCLAVAVALICGSCHRGAAPAARAPPPPAPTLTDAETLDACSPFASIDDRRLIVFNRDTHLAAEGFATSDSPVDEDALADDLEMAAEGARPGARGDRVAEIAAPPGISTGRFDVDPRTKVLTLRFGAEMEHLTLLTPAPLLEDECILVAGAMRSADLTRSLFGAAASEPPGDTDIPDATAVFDGAVGGGPSSAPAAPFLAGYGDLGNASTSTVIAKRGGLYRRRAIKAVS